MANEAMAGEAEVQVSHFLDQQGVGAFQVKLIFWSILIALIDGYDIGAIAFAISTTSSAPIARAVSKLMSNCS